MKDLHLAIGIFDGLHIGHRMLIGKARERAQKDNAWSGVLSFYPHPQKALNSPNAQALVYPIQQRRQLLQDLGVDYVFIKRFTSTWARFSPDRFFQFLKRIFPNLHTIYVGEDFHFGFQRQGDIHTLEAFCKRDAHVHLNVTQRLTYDHEIVCSSHIREFLKLGQLSLANPRLQIPYHRWGHLQAFPQKNTYKVQFLYTYELQLPANISYPVQIQYQNTSLEGYLRLDKDSATLFLDNIHINSFKDTYLLYFL